MSRHQAEKEEQRRADRPQCGLHSCLNTRPNAQNKRLRSELQRVQYPPKRRDARAHVCSVPTAVHHAGPVQFPAPDAR